MAENFDSRPNLPSSDLDSTREVSSTYCYEKVYLSVLLDQICKVLRKVEGFV